MLQRAEGVRTSDRRTIHDRPPELHDVLREVLGPAGEIALRLSGRVERARKADGTEVCEADTEAEAAIAAALRVAFPGDGIVSEEGALVPTSGDRTWWIDPIDGTSAYLDGLPTWGPTVCLVEGGTLVAGALFLPRVGEFWYAERGRGAWRDGNRLSPPAPGEPGRHDSLYLPSRFHRRMPIDWPGKVRALGASSVHLALVAGGGGVATIVPRWSLWDVGCGVLLVEESGRIVTDLAGGPLDPVAKPGEALIAGTPDAVAWLTSRQGPG